MGGRAGHRGPQRTFWNDGNTLYSIFIVVVFIQQYTFAKVLPSKCEFHSTEILPQCSLLQKKGVEGLVKKTRKKKLMDTDNNVVIAGGGGKG